MHEDDYNDYEPVDKELTLKALKSAWHVAPDDMGLMELLDTLSITTPPVEMSHEELIRALHEYTITNG